MAVQGEAVQFSPMDPGPRWTERFGFFLPKVLNFRS